MRRVVLMALLLASVTTVSAIVLSRSVQSTAFLGDESGWISSGIYYSDLVLNRDLTWEKWRCGACATWGSLNPQIGKLMIGLPLRIYSSIHSPERGDDFDGYYDFAQSFDANLAQGRVPPNRSLIRARSTTVVIGVLCCLLVFGIGYLSDSWWTEGPQGSCTRAFHRLAPAGLPHLSGATFR